jgi:hypothetical protein
VCREAAAAYGRARQAEGRWCAAALEGGARQGRRGNGGCERGGGAWTALVTSTGGDGGARREGKGHHAAI